MIIPESFSTKYDEEFALLEQVREYAGSRLRILASENNWLFDDRIKSRESSLSKVEQGKTSLRQMNDFYAAMVVVPTRKHVDNAAARVLDLFEANIKEPRTVDPSVFVYDDTHIIAKLGNKISPAAARHPNVLERQFEIQIHTGVEYAWWRATHDELYKGDSKNAKSWKAQRASGQARAALELVDGILGDFATAAMLQRDFIATEGHVEKVVSWLSRWKRRQRPADEVRFAESVQGMLVAFSVDPDEIEKILYSNKMDDIINNDKITPIQAIFISFHMKLEDEFITRLAASNRKILVTEEVEVAYPDFATIPTGFRVML